MPNGQIIKGEDGIILLKDESGTTIGEIPCLTSWTIEASASLSAQATRCMKSNGDGGSASAADWATQTVESKSFNISAEFNWQKDDQIPAGVALDPTKVGDKVTFELYPDDDTAGEVVYTGAARIESVSVPSEVNGNITQSATLQGDGALTRDTVA